MRTLPILATAPVVVPVVALAVALLAGCNAAPSTPLAPDQKPPDASKMSPQDVDRMLKQNGARAERSR